MSRKKECINGIIWYVTVMCDNWPGMYWCVCVLEDGANVLCAWVQSERCLCIRYACIRRNENTQYQKLRSYLCASDFYGGIVNVHGGDSADVVCVCCVVTGVCRRVCSHGCQFVRPRQDLCLVGEREKVGPSVVKHVYVCMHVCI